MPIYEVIKKSNSDKMEKNNCYKKAISKYYTLFCS